jgi:ABC-type polysaccharide/polyol phosphate transport system ATPase subunit
MTLEANAIEMDDVHKSFKIYKRRATTLKEALLRGRAEYEQLHVLDGVSLTVPHGQSIGLVGRNGAGKSTTLKVMCGLIPPDSGDVTVNGRVSTLLELGAGFQGEYTGRENVFLYGALMGLSNRFIQERFDEIVEFAGPQVVSALDNPVKNYSSGMYMRLAFAVAVHVDPDVLIVDEVLAVGDEGFQRKCFERTHQLRADGKTIVMVSHNMDAVRKFCDRALWIDQGRILADGRPEEVIPQYMEMVNTMADAKGIATGGPDSVHFEDVHVEDGSGRTGDAVRSGDRVRVVFTANSGGGVARGHVYVRWYASDGACVVGANSKEMGALEVGPDPVTWACEFPTLPLAAGSYRVEVTMGDAESGQLLSWAHPPLVPAVIGPPSDGWLALPGRFSRTGSSGAAAASPGPESAGS